MDFWIFILYFGLEPSLHYSFCWSNCPTFDHWQHFMFGCFWHVQYFCFLCTLISGTIRCSRIIFYSLCFESKLGHFSKDSCFILLKNYIYKYFQNLQARCAHFYCNVSYHFNEMILAYLLATEIFPPPILIPNFHYLFIACFPFCSTNNLWIYYGSYLNFVIRSTLFSPGPTI